MGSMGAMGLSLPDHIKLCLILTSSSVISTSGKEEYRKDLCFHTFQFVEYTLKYV